MEHGKGTLFFAMTKVRTGPYSLLKHNCYSGRLWKKTYIVDNQQNADRMEQDLEFHP